MSSLFAFRCWTERNPLPTSTLVVFSGPSEFSINDLTSAIVDETRKALSPEAVYLLYPSAYFEDVAEKLAAIPDSFAPLAPDTAVTLFGYDLDGSITLHRALRGEAISEFSHKDIRQQGLTTLFSRRGGLLEAGPTAHFIKPSGKTDSRFLRASHALSEGAEIFFTAFWLLPYLENDVRFIHLDTSSIASVVMAALLMRKQNKLPIIRTFQSYGGMSKYKFSRDRSDIVLISASQSGSMASEISKKIGDPKCVITLFATDADNAPGTILCDLRRDELRNANGLGPARKVSNTVNSRPIKLIGEHFVAEPEPPRAIVPAKKHAPPIVGETLPNLKGKKIFSSNKISAQDEVRAVWVDTDNLSGTKAFHDWVKRIVKRTLPAATRAIIHPGKGESSKNLAKALLREVRASGGELKDIEVLSLDDIEAAADKPRWPSEEIPVVIAGGATGHGEDLLAVSRALRQWAPKSHRIFLSMATMPSSSKGFSFLKTNLCQPNHEFHSMFELFIDRRRAAESWKLEKNLLNDNEDTLPLGLKERLTDLLSAKGLVDNLFLAGKKGELKLRDNFAFWPPETNCGDAQQADVFLSIAAIMENMRSDEKMGAGDRLINTTQSHSILSAGTFSRYNDGIIQAAFLRAALPVELNYQDAPEHSRLITDLIAQMADLADKFQGESLSEFLLALALGRLTVIEQDMSRLRANLKGKLANLSEIQRWLVDFLLK